MRLARDTVLVDRSALDTLHARIERLRVAVVDASYAGDEVARRCRSASAAICLDKLTAWFEGQAGLDKEEGT